MGVLAFAMGLAADRPDSMDSRLVRRICHSMQFLCQLRHVYSPMIKFHFDAGKNSIFYEFELSKILKHPVVF